MSDKKLLLLQWVSEWTLQYGDWNLYSGAEPLDYV